MGTTDTNGIYQYDGSDQVSPIHTLLNLGMSSVSSRIQATPKIVANVTARAAYASGKTVNAANPLLVWRADAPVGMKLEYTINGTNWFYYSDSAIDTGWVNVTVLSPFVAHTNFTPQVRRIDKTVFFRGGWSNASMGANNTYTVGTVPVDFRPGASFYSVMVSNSTAATGARFALVSTTGAISISTLATVGTYNIGNYSWLVD